MDTAAMTDLFAAYLLEHPEKTITQAYNCFAVWLYHTHGIMEISHAEELLKIALSIRQLPKEEQAKILPVLKLSGSVAE